MPPFKYTKDKDERLDYFTDFTPWLEGDTIIGAAGTVGEGGSDLTVDEVAFTPTAVTIWVVGGLPRERYIVTCRITTATGRIKDQDLQITIREG